MKTKPRHCAVNLVTFGIMLLIAAGCRSSRYRARSNPELEETRVVKERQYVEQANEIKERERHYLYRFKPERNLQDPLWTPP